MREKYESLALSVLRDLAKARGLKGTSGMKKSEVVEAMLAEDERQTAEAEKQAKDAPAKPASEKTAPARPNIDTQGNVASTKPASAAAPG